MDRDAVRARLFSHQRCQQRIRISRTPRLTHGRNVIDIYTEMDGGGHHAVTTVMEVMQVIQATRKTRFCRRSSYYVRQMAWLSARSVTDRHFVTLSLPASEGVHHLPTLQLPAFEATIERGAQQPSCIDARFAIAQILHREGA